MISNGVPRYEGKGIEFLMDYNLIDVKGCVDLDKKFDATNKQGGRADVAIAPFEDGLFASKLHDHFKLTQYQHDYAFDTKYQKFERRELKSKKHIGDKFVITLKDLEKISRDKGKDVTYNSLEDVHKVGGFVPKPPKRGIYTNVAVIDFSKYYPNMIKTCNAGIISAVDVVKEYWFCVVGRKYKGTDKEEVEVYDRKNLIETPYGYFRKDIKSLNAKVFDKWISIRKKAQKKADDYLEEVGTTKDETYKLLDNDQFNIKGFTNAGFGVFGLPIDRNFSKLAFNSCTISCQDIIHLVIYALEKYGYEIVGGDTDSVFLKLKTEGIHEQIAEAKRVCTVLNIVIHNYMHDVYNVDYDKNTIDIDLETVSPTFYIDGKKHYVKWNKYVDGTILDEPELEVKGMDLKKRATSKLGADVQENLIKMLRDGLDAMEEYLVDLDNQLEDMPWTYVCKRGALNKHLDEYPDSNESATAARNFLKYFGRYYQPGSNPYLGVFEKYPRKINGQFVVADGDLKLSFLEEDVEMLKELGFELNFDSIRKSQIHLKSQHLLGIYNTDFYEIVQSADQGDFLDF